MPPVVMLDTTPHAEVACSSLVQTDNKLFNKVIIVFAFLCDEAAAMQEHARSAANCAIKSATAPDFDATTQILTKASKILEQAAATLVEAMGLG